MYFSVLSNSAPGAPIVLIFCDGLPRSHIPKLFFDGKTTHSRTRLCVTGWRKAFRIQNRQQGTFEDEAECASTRMCADLGNLGFVDVPIHRLNKPAHISHTWMQYLMQPILQLCITWVTHAHSKNEDGVRYLGIGDAITI
jgi:hypothetical protein